MVIASLPPVHQEDLLKEIITHPCVSEVRFNTGMRSAYEPREVIRRIKKYTEPLNKPLYIDLKGRQLRIIEWANLPDGPIILNHDIEVKLPAKVYFRGDDRCYDLKEVINGNEIFVDPIPKAPVGQGQSVNIVSDELKIFGGLLPLDMEYIRAAAKEGIFNFLLSFVEGWDDILELESSINAYPHHGKNNIRLKIESEAGLNFITRQDVKLEGYRLMAARDDLMIHIGILNMIKALEVIIKKDPQAICASRIFLGLEEGKESMADISDLELMRKLGYRNFMFSDGISREHFPAAINLWQRWHGCKNVKY